MGKSHPMELRKRVIAFVDEGHRHRAAARHFRVSPKFVNDLVKLRRETGSIAPRRQGNGGGHGKLVAVQDWIEARVAAKGEITLDELVRELAEEHGINVHRVSVWRALHGCGLTHKKKTFKPLNRNVRMCGRRVISGFPNVSPSWPGIWKG